MTDVEFHVICPHLEYVALPSHIGLYEPDQTFRFVYFPNEGLISLVVAMANGKTVEAGIVGSEGVAGLPAVMGLSRSPLREVMQIGGNGFRVKIRDLKKNVGFHSRSSTNLAALHDEVGATCCANGSM